MWSYGASIALYIQAAAAWSHAWAVFLPAPFSGSSCRPWCGEGIQVQHYIAGMLFVGAIVLLWLESHVHQHKHTLLTHGIDTGTMTAIYHRHPGLDRSTEHTHWHEHEPIVHVHPHWPDLHHRHIHDFSEQSAE